MRHETEDDMKMTKASLAALLGMVLSAPAGAVSIANGSFETFTGAVGGDGGAAVSAGQTPLTGWSVILQTAVLETPNIYGLLPSTGTNFLDLTSYSSIGGGAVQGVEQLVSGLDLREVYQVSLDLGVSNAPCVRGGVNCTGPISVQASAGGVSSRSRRAAKLAALASVKRMPQNGSAT